mmetsp:Transcript_20386/g.36575  ORF Transcript_20386/g.36575 Transcript_20386/m.36575 type:complete len:525 (-) Transcript_20386:216-1790(-)
MRYTCACIALAQLVLFFLPCNYCLTDFTSFHVPHTLSSTANIYVAISSVLDIAKGLVETLGWSSKIYENKTSIPKCMWIASKSTCKFNPEYVFSFNYSQSSSSFDRGLLSILKKAYLCSSVASKDKCMTHPTNINCEWSYFGVRDSVSSTPVSVTAETLTNSVSLPDPRSSATGSNASQGFGSHRRLDSSRLTGVDGVNPDKEIMSEKGKYSCHYAIDDYDTLSFLFKSCSDNVYSRRSLQCFMASDSRSVCESLKCIFVQNLNNTAASSPVVSPLRLPAPLPSPLVSPPPPPLNACFSPSLLRALASKSGDARVVAVQRMEAFISRGLVTRLGFGSCSAGPVHFASQVVCVHSSELARHHHSDEERHLINPSKNHSHSASLLKNGIKAAEKGFRSSNEVRKEVNGRCLVTSSGAALVKRAMASSKTVLPKATRVRQEEICQIGAGAVQDADNVAARHQPLCIMTEYAVRAVILQGSAVLRTVVEDSLECESAGRDKCESDPKTSRPQPLQLEWIEERRGKPPP